jgi:hypothetical protein
MTSEGTEQFMKTKSGLKNRKNKMPDFSAKILAFFVVTVAVLGSFLWRGIKYLPKYLYFSVKNIFVGKKALAKIITVQQQTTSNKNGFLYEIRCNFQDEDGETQRFSFYSSRRFYNKLATEKASFFQNPLKFQQKKPIHISPPKYINVKYLKTKNNEIFVKKCTKIMNNV